jgi:hypothetical protein
MKSNHLANNWLQRKIRSKVPWSQEKHRKEKYAHEEKPFETPLEKFFAFFSYLRGWFVLL